MHIHTASSPDFKGTGALGYAAYLIHIATHWMALMHNSRLFYRVFCVVCGLLGIGIYIESLYLGDWHVYLGIAALLVGLVAASLVTRRW
jgi:hypothetical protein